MTLISIDASTKSTGIAYFKNNKLVDYLCLNASETEMLDRINTMTKQVSAFCNKYKPDTIIMQEVLPQDVKHNQTVFKALIYLQAMIALNIYHDLNKKIQFIVASHWRKVCGIKTGRAIKREQLKKASQSLVKERFNIQVNDDISDAICLGISYLNEHASAF